MGRERRIAAIITGLVAFGCATQPPTGPAGAPAGQGGQPGKGVAGYSLQDEPTVAEVEIAGASASSTRNTQFFGAGNAIDDNNSSAWGPAAGDADPALTLDLGAATTVVGVKVKLSLGQNATAEDARVKVTVEAVADDGTSTTLASGWTPAETTLSSFDVPATSTGRIRLRFDTQGAGGLLVCDARVVGSSGPVPSPTPTITPSGEPTPTPSPVPSDGEATIEGVAVSSTRAGSWFVAGNAVDGNPTSAWGAAPGDDAPTLTLDLAGEPVVTAVQLKLSLGAIPAGEAAAAAARVSVTVEAIAADGTATTLATGWTPTEGSLQTLDVPDTPASQVRFTFDTGGADGLLVCDANVLTGPAASPTPEPSPTATPEPTPTPTEEPTPTPTPSVEPTPTPTPSVEPTPTPAPTTITFALTGANEVPPRETDATGSITFTLSEDGTSLDYDITLAGLENLTNAHIHLGAPGVNGGIVANLIADGTELDALTADDLVGDLAGSTIADLVARIEAGTVYVNVHTDDGVDPPDTGAGDFPGGELRGQIVP